MINGPGAMQQAVAQKQTQVGGDWFFWIAGVSFASSILAAFGIGIYSWLGLGTTQAIDSGQLGLPKEGALALDIAAAAFYVLYGYFARKGARWAFIAGAIFYMLDGVLLLVFRQWLSAAFHAYALFRIFQGFQAARLLAVLRSQSAGYGNPGYVPPSSNPSSDVWPPPPSA